MRGIAKRAGQCRFCRSCTCNIRIIAIGFDEVACRDHVAELEAFAGAELPPGWPREMIVSTGPLRRGWHCIDTHRPLTRSPVAIDERTARTVIPALSREERDVMRHALGIRPGRDGRDRHDRRNYYYSGGAYDPVWAGLAARGLAILSHGPSSDFQGSSWRVTRAGRVLVGAQLDEGRP